MDNEMSDNQMEKFITISVITMQLKTRGSFRDYLTSENEGLFRGIRKTYNKGKYPKIFFFSPLTSQIWAIIRNALERNITITLKSELFGTSVKQALSKLKNEQQFAEVWRMKVNKITLTEGFGFSFFEEIVKIYMKIRPELNLGIYFKWSDLRFLNTRDVKKEQKNLLYRLSYFKIYFRKDIQLSRIFKKINEFFIREN